MAAVDFNAEPGFDGRGFDVVIVGAGAAGLYLASLLAGRRRVCVLESGHWAVDGERQELNEIEQTGKRMQNAVETRRRAIGGTTLAWGGQSLPFAPADFARWPFGRGSWSGTMRGRMRRWEWTRGGTGRRRSGSWG